MKAKFNDFINENKNCSGLSENQDAKAVFNIISKDSNIIKMIQYSEFGKPALEACVIEIEGYYTNRLNPEIDLKDSFTKQAIGRMVKTILNIYGYEVDGQKDISRSISTKYFTSASCYRKSEESTFSQIIIMDDIMEFHKGNKVYNNLHLMFSLKFRDDDYYNTTEVTINNKAYKLSVRYPFRSQGNDHLIFYSEDGQWFRMSFDGHKGDMFVNSNEIIDRTINVLNGTEDVIQYNYINDELNVKTGFKIKSDDIFEILNKFSDNK